MADNILEDVMQRAYSELGQGNPQEPAPTDPGTQTPPVQPAPTANPAPVNDDNTPAASATNQAFARMRTENANYAKQAQLMETIVKGMGFSSVEEFITKKQEEQVQQAASKNSISVETERRIRELEDQNRRYAELRFQDQLKRDVKDLVDKYQIDAATWQKFVDTSGSNAMQAYQNGVSLETLFVQSNQDFVFQARLAAEKKKWEEALANQGQAPVVTPQGNPQPTAPTNPNKVDFRELGAKFKK